MLCELNTTNRVTGYESEGMIEMVSLNFVCSVSANKVEKGEGTSWVCVEPR
jgi:hypothetical protein